MTNKKSPMNHTSEHSSHHQNDTPQMEHHSEESGEHGEKHGSHDAHAGHCSGSGHDHHNHGSFKEIFLKSLPFGIIIMLLSPMMGISLPFQFSFLYSDILAAVLSTILIVYGGKPFYMGPLMNSNKKSLA